MWYHSFDSDDWSENGFQMVQRINTNEDLWITINAIKNTVKFTLGMYYLMKADNMPLWDSPKNINGGGYTYKLNINDATDNYIYMLILFFNNLLTLKNNDSIIGISVSPKIKYSIIRIWTLHKIDSLSFNRTKLFCIENFGYTPNNTKK